MPGSGGRVANSAKSAEIRADAGTTAGEKLAGRPLAKEVRAGVEHYVPGQWDTVVHVGGRDFFTDESLDVGRITYVDQMGHLCVILTLRQPSLTGAWWATWVSRAGQTFSSEARRLDSPDEFPLTDRMLTALAEARIEPWPSAPRSGATQSGVARG